MTATNIEKTTATEQGTGKPESELRAAARRRELTMKELVGRVRLN